MIELLIHNAGELVTAAGPGSKAGRRQGDLGAIANGAIAVANGKIELVGPSEEVLGAVAHENVVASIDASGKTVLPGFVDPHTHLVFAGTREIEYERRLAGATYLEISATGGGINSTVLATRTATADALAEQAAHRLATMLAHGTTTVEAKSGYGLDLQDELKCLAVARELDALGGTSIVSTFLGAHAVPPEFAGRSTEYVDLVVDQMLPAVAEGRLADFCDVFCDEGAFTLLEARRILTRARQLGFGLKVHADEFVNLGAAALASELRAVSADHLVVTPANAMAALARSGVVAVLLPATTFHLGHQRYAPARDFIAAGVPVAIGTDFNPGTSYTESMQMAIAIACSQMKLSPAEAIVASTIYAAHAIARGSSVGSLEPGKQADIVILDIPNHRHLGYHFGVNLVETVVKRGQIVHPRHVRA